MKDPSTPTSSSDPIGVVSSNHLRESGHQYGTVDLRTCDREPIHVPGAIQPHGVLLALHEVDMEIAVASDNAAELLGCDPVVVGQLLSELLGEEPTEAIRQFTRATPGVTSPVRFECNDRQWDGIVHQSDGLLILELEPAEPDPPERFLDFYRRARTAVARLQKGTRVLELCRVAAYEVRNLTGFDRVMVYRFAADGSGEVVAEAKRQDLDSFLGLHYPAADIPPQARRLYKANWLRLISEIDYEPVPLVPPHNPLTGRPLDLTHSVLRSVSPIHREYLHNMGVGASMSVTLLSDDDLWGLIACHHYSGSHFIPYEVRSSCEFLAQALSWQISARERGEASDRVAEANEVRSRLLRQLSIHENLDSALARDEEALLAVTRATGAAICIDSNCSVVGQTPDWDDINRILDVLRPLVDDDGIFATDRLGELVEDLPEPLGNWAGALLITLDEGHNDLVLWLRGEQRQTVTWGHDGSKAGIGPRENAERLSPLGSFRTWEETVRGRSLPWLPWEIDSARRLRGALMETAVRRAAEFQRLNQELRHAAEMKDEFLATVSHELRNPMQAILGWSRLLASNQLPDERQARGLEVVQRNAEVQSQLIDDLLDVSRIISGKMRLEMTLCDLGEVVDAAVDTVASAAEARGITISQQIDSSAVDVQGDPDRLQQIVWNLLSNAIKFTPKGGRADVRVERVNSSSRIVVQDNGEGIEPEHLDSIFDRFHQGRRKSGGHGGLGLGLSIVNGLTELHGGTVRAYSDGTGSGSRFEVTLPLASVRGSSTETSHTSPPGFPEDTPSLHGVRVLVVDDEKDATELLSEILGSCGAQVLVANSGHEALELLNHHEVDVLLSDIGMPDMDGFELLRTIRERAPEGRDPVPAAALTAYGRSQDRTRAFRAGFQTHLSKPVEPLEVQTVIANLAGRID